MQATDAYREHRRSHEQMLTSIRTLLVKPSRNGSAPRRLHGWANFDSGNATSAKIGIQHRNLHAGHIKNACH